jgi:hypothetical protein
VVLALVSEPVPIRNRRQTDPQFAQLIELAQQNHELIGVTVQRVNELMGKVTIWEKRLANVEKVALEGAQVRQDFGTGELSPKQRAGLPSLLEWWDDQKDEADSRLEKLHRDSMRAAVIQAITGVCVVVLTIISMIALYRH